MQSTPGLSPGEAHGQRSLAGYSPRGRKESGTTERLHLHFQQIGRGVYEQPESWVQQPVTEQAPSGQVRCPQVLFFV